jgi:hypothetical protein
VHAEQRDPDNLGGREKAETGSVLSGYYGNKISESETMSTAGLLPAIGCAL